MKVGRRTPATAINILHLMVAVKCPEISLPDLQLELNDVVDAHRITRAEISSVSRAACVIISPCAASS